MISDYTIYRDEGRMDRFQTNPVPRPPEELMKSYRILRFLFANRGRRDCYTAEDLGAHLTMSPTAVYNRLLQLADDLKKQSGDYEIASYEGECESGRSETFYYLKSRWCPRPELRKPVPESYNPEGEA